MHKNDSKKPIRIALYGGSFSPPHLGHASVIEAILRLFPCDQIWVMPSADRHDKNITAKGEDRIKMLQLMVNELFPNPKVPIIVSDFELKLNKPTVTYETLRLLKDEHPEYIFYFILGSENLNVIEKGWVNGEKLLKEAEFIAIKNPTAPIPENLPSNITILNNTVWTNLSSTFIRNIVKNGGSGVPYISKGVADYIKKNKLYI